MPASAPVSTFARRLAGDAIEVARYRRFCRAQAAERLAALRLAARRRALRHRVMLAAAILAPATAIVALRLAGLA